MNLWGREATLLPLTLSLPTPLQLDWWSFFNSEKTLFQINGLFLDSSSNSSSSDSSPRPLSPSRILLFFSLSYTFWLAVLRVINTNWTDSVFSSNLEKKKWKNFSYPVACGGLSSVGRLSCKENQNFWGKNWNLSSWH